MKLDTILDSNINIHGVDFSLEDGSFNLTGFTTFYTGFIGKVLKIFENRAALPLAINKTEQSKAAQLINKAKATDLEHFTIITPEYVSGPIIPYLETLHSVFKEVIDIEDRLLKPLEQWAANMITDPTYGEKAWISIPLNVYKEEATTDKLHKFFNDSVSGGTANRLFIATYKDSKGLDNATTIITDLNILSNKALSGKLAQRATSVSKLIHQLASAKNTANELSVINKEKLQPVVELAAQTAKELESISICLYLTHTAGYAHNESIDKIIKNFK